MNLEIVNPLEIPHWDDLIRNHPEGTIFHSAAWARVLHETYGYAPVYFASFENGALTTLFPCMDIRSWLTGRRGVSLPFTDYCRVILPDAVSFHEAFASVVQHGAKAGWRTIEMRSDAAIPVDVPASSSYYGHILDLSKGEQALQAGLRVSTRRNVKKAAKEGVSVTLESSLDSVRHFYRLNCLTRKLHGLPPQPFRFFETLHRHILAQGLGTIALASYRGQSIAGAVFLQFGDRAVYKYGASDRAYQHLRANNLIMWEAIRYYVQQGSRWFCFGRTEPENDGLLQFKRGWGAREEMLTYHKYDFSRASFLSRTQTTDGGLGKKVFEAMPLPLLRLAGELLYRHVG
jgi:hypothetical protein